MEKKFYTEKECDDLGIPWSRTSRWRARKDRKLGYLSINGRIFYSKEQIDAYIQIHERPAKDARPAK